MKLSKEIGRQCELPDLLPRRIALRSLRSGLPVSASELASTADVAVPDSTALSLAGWFECPPPTSSTLSPHIRRTRVLAYKRRTFGGEHLTTMNASNGSKHVAYSGSEQCSANAPPYSSCFR